MNRKLLCAIRMKTLIIISLLSVLITTNTCYSTSYVIRSYHYLPGDIRVQKVDSPYLDTLLRLLKDNPNIAIEIGGHSDLQETKTNDTILSFKRALEIKTFLMVGGINSENIIIKGYGSKNPVAPERNPDGTINVKGAERNRRVEFKIVTAHNNN